MIDQIIIMLSQSKVGWGILGAIGLIATVFAVYYISFAIYLIVASIYSGVKLIPESYRVWRADVAAEYDISWGGAELGVTMPDGGEPVEEEEEKEKEA
ncbi:MAG: hypothetical protein AMJ60_00235 [Desulfobacterales bacterium SG8_35]|nr:MAG: hypothetical protein AMJ60_00235 [Desulfobacterales bacterium SG8_35]